MPSAEGDNRKIQMDLISTNMIKTIEVNKTITPDMDADAISLCKWYNYENPNKIINLHAKGQTDAVKSDDDAADDPAIWVNPNDVSKSTIIGTNKQSGIDVYNLDGKLIYQYNVGRVNNVDIRYGYIFKNDTVSIVAATNSITVFTVNNSTGQLNEVSGNFEIKMREVYGFGMYKSPKTNKFYGIIIGKEGEVAQYEFKNQDNKIGGNLVREFKLSTQGEGVVADDFHSKLYLGEENKGL